MKLLIDNALSPAVVLPLQQAGHDVIHVRDLDKQSAPDDEILQIAAEQHRTIVSADTDFGALLAIRQKPRPSFVLFRKTTGVRPSVLVEQLIGIVADYADDLRSGCVLTVTNERIRIRRLPIS